MLDEQPIQGVRYRLITGGKARKKGRPQVRREIERAIEQFLFSG